MFSVHRVHCYFMNCSYSPVGFDPNFPMMAGMRYPPTLPGPIPHIPISPDEQFELDENGEVNWQLAWHKEIGHLQTLTAEQEKAGVDSEWYRMMLFRIRSALMPPPPMNPEMMHAMAPHLAAPPQPPPTGTIQPQQQPVQQ
jgi:forkhead box protein J2/3